MEGQSDVHIFLISLIYVILIALCVNTTATLKTNSVNDSQCSMYNNECKYPISNHNKIKNTILKRWKTNNISNPRQCSSSQRKYYDNKNFVQFLPIPKMNSYPCKRNQTPPRCLFRGKIKDGCLEGKGKLKMLSEKDWGSLPKDVQKDITKNNGI